MPQSRKSPMADPVSYSCDKIAKPPHPLPASPPPVFSLAFVTRHPLHDGCLRGLQLTALLVNPNIVFTSRHTVDGELLTCR